MPGHVEELLGAAERLLVRRSGQRGVLSGARLRRSISTSYYALFHFLVEEAGNRLIGTHNDLRRRRRTFGRLFTHQGMKTALDKVRGAQVDRSVADLLRPRGAASGPVACPTFVRSIAATFSDAQIKRHDADYDLNAEPTEADAHLLISQVRDVIVAWQAADAAADTDFKHALCMLMPLKGKLKRDD